MDYSPQMKNRIKRIEGQLRGILRMMEEGKDCKSVVTQMSAARTAIDRTMGLVVSANLVNCVLESEKCDQDQQKELIESAVELLMKSR
ncbi:MAG: metal-sensitive transcriptional regulator [Amphibacillus sp.]|uniref:Uncharacterized protein n=1 Tax=Amphibacillus xylanus (strain ATCC 51415 / DSM 6626 / JCM 7361 / LMG 17667 / NBRC 15112 / Ep01) TaxID=698758 RepID=K0J545_AMPXN|nr:metal-sensitive transcriptional regulator [Amphibacillus xylanus]NMA90264.1 metal-sensitive transcriptional regulator [Amphibacillus sp.]BAM47991.1 hypothetical protein AXY_18590 [Amphibacillus xylanus NBRC 15112]